MKTLHEILADQLAASHPLSVLDADFDHSEREDFMFHEDGSEMAWDEEFA